MNSFINVGIEETAGQVVSVKDFAEKFDLKILYAEPDAMMKLSTVSVNRPGLILSGFNDYFAESRVQVVGNAEIFFLNKLSDSARKSSLKKLFSHEIPCLVISRGFEPCKNMIDIAKEYKCPILSSQDITTEIVNDIINYLNDLLAPKTQIHGVLLDIDGVGVLLTGRSGIGKSETALELVHRGHMLVSDDAVELKCVKNTIIGSAPDRIREFMELRGVGIINVKNMYGVAGVLKSTEVDLVIELVEYDKSKPYGRSDELHYFFDVLGVQIPKLVIPVMMGRNLAIIVEVAAKNFQLQRGGYDANIELANRIDKSLK